jgi:hypothetical protein
LRPNVPAACPIARYCRDACFRRSQVTWRTSAAHHPTEDTCLTEAVSPSRIAEIRHT